MLSIKKITFTIILIVVFSQIYGQTYFTARMNLVSYHPVVKNNVNLFQAKISTKPAITLEPGLFLGYEIPFNRKIRVGLSASALKNPYNQISVNSEIYIKYRYYKYYRHLFYIGFGPSAHFSSNRSSIAGYKNEEKYYVYDNFIYKVSWLSGFLEYGYYLSKRSRFVLALNHVHPYSIGISAGMTYKIYSNKGGCGCKSYK